MGKHFVGKEKPKEEAEKRQSLSLSLLHFLQVFNLLCPPTLRTAACKPSPCFPPFPSLLPLVLHVFLDFLRLLCELFFGSPRLGSAFIISHNHLTVQRKSVESARRRAPFSLGRAGAWQFGEKYFVEQAISWASYARFEILSKDSRHESMWSDFNSGLGDDFASI